MASEHSEEENPDAPPKRRLNLTPAVMLMILSGTLFALLLGGAIYHVLSGKALKAELAASKKELQEKAQQVDEAHEQIAGLSKQVRSLREFSAAKAAEVAALAGCEPATAGKTAAAPQPGAPDGAAPENRKVAPIASAPSARRSRPAVQDCQLVGKSAEEQAATLQRCMQILDSRR